MIVLVTVTGTVYMSHECIVPMAAFILRRVQKQRAASITSTNGSIITK